MARVIIIRGPLGVGKTTVSKRLAEKLNGVYFSVDEVMDDLDLAHAEKGGGIPLKNFIAGNLHIAPYVNKSMAQGVDAVIDGNFYYHEQVDHLIEVTKGEHKVFTLTAPIETCVARDKKRETPHGEAAAKAVHAMCEDLDVDEVIETKDMTSGDVVIKILDSLKKWGKQ